MATNTGIADTNTAATSPASAEVSSEAATAARAGSMVRLGTFQRYEEAQELVDRLSDAGFEVRRTAIVAEGLRLYEQVTGRLNWLRASGRGAVQGLVVGLFIAWLFAVFSLVAPAMGFLNVLLWGAGIGLVIGAILGLLSYAATGGRRDFTSVSGVQAATYTVLVEADFADQARQILGLPVTGGAEVRSAVASE